MNEAYRPLANEQIVNVETSPTEEDYKRWDAEMRTRLIGRIRSHVAEVVESIEKEKDPEHNLQEAEKVAAIGISTRMALQDPKDSDKLIAETQASYQREIDALDSDAPALSNFPAVDMFATEFLDMVRLGEARMGPDMEYYDVFSERFFEKR